MKRLYSELDSVDREILRLMQEDGSLSKAALAEKLSLSVTPCWRRLKRLEDEGFIEGFQANLNREQLGFGVLAFAQLVFTVHTNDAPNRFEKAILAHPEIQSCHKVTGSADYLLQIVAEDLNSYGEFVERVLRKLPGVTSIHSSLALREIKAQHRLPVR